MRKQKGTMKKRWMPKGIVCLLLLAVLGGSMPVSPVFAYNDSYYREYKVTDDGAWAYDYNTDGTVLIARYSGSAANVIVPDQIDGRTVTKIAEEAFYSCKLKGQVVSIEIPDTVTEIGQRAFLNLLNILVR